MSRKNKVAAGGFEPEKKGASLEAPLFFRTFSEHSNTVRHITRILRV